MFKQPVSTETLQEESCLDLHVPHTTPVNPRYYKGQTFMLREGEMKNISSLQNKKITHFSVIVGC